MKKVENITSFAIALLVAVTINFSSTNVQANEIEYGTKSVGLTSKTTPLTGTNIISYAKQFIGTPYKSGGTTTAGFDCSGFTKYVYSHFNISLPRTAAAQTSKGITISKSNLKTGDLVFFGKPINHVGMYVGGGLFIHSPKTGSAIMIADLNYMPAYNTARRIISL